MTDAEYLKKLGERIYKARKDKGLSQGGLGAICNMDRQNISNIELGKKNIQATTIYRLAKALGIEAKELLDFE